jgi:hypothetical protein
MVVEVPDDAVLMAEECSIAPQLEAYGLLKPAEDACLEIQGLILALMHEHCLGNRSKWSGYISFFPSSLDLPFTWLENELSELQGTAAMDKMEAKVQSPADAPTRVEELWNEVALPFISDHPNLPGFKRYKGIKGEEGKRLYDWATSIVSSYSFVLGDDKFQALVPIWDALNHITGKKNVRLHHDKKKNALQMIAISDIQTGQELVNDYGPLSNSELLRAYGFIERLPRPHPSPLPSHSSSSLQSLARRFNDATVPGNLWSHIQVPFVFLTQAIRGEKETVDDKVEEEEEEEEKDKRRSFLNHHRLLPRSGVIKVHHTDVERALAGKREDLALSLCNLMESIRVLHLTETEFSSFRMEVKRWRMPMPLPIPPQTPATTKMTLASAKRLFDLMSSRYPSSLDQDLKILSSSESLASLGARHQAVIVARADERAVLALLSEWLGYLSIKSENMTEMSHRVWREARMGKRREDRDSDEEEGDSDEEEEEEEGEEGEEPEMKRPRIETKQEQFSFNFF